MDTRLASNTRSGHRLGWVLGLTSTAYFMVVLDSLVVVSALPHMQHDLHASVPSLQWTVNSYGISFAAGIVTAAALGDRFGRRTVFHLGLLLFTVASALCALAPNLADLVAARTVQGLGAAAVMPLSLTILTAAFPAGRRGLRRVRGAGDAQLLRPHRTRSCRSSHLGSPRRRRRRLIRPTHHDQLHR